MIPFSCVVAQFYLIKWISLAISDLLPQHVPAHLEKRWMTDCHGELPTHRIWTSHIGFPFWHLDTCVNLIVRPQGWVALYCGHKMETPVCFRKFKTRWTSYNVLNGYVHVQWNLLLKISRLDTICLSQPFSFDNCCVWPNHFTHLEYPLIFTPNFHCNYRLPLKTGFAAYIFFVILFLGRSFP